MEPDKIIKECSFVVGDTWPVGLKYDCAGALLSMSGSLEHFVRECMWPGKSGTFDGRLFRVEQVEHKGSVHNGVGGTWTSFTAREIQT